MMRKDGEIAFGLCCIMRNETKRFGDCEKANTFCLNATAFTT